MNDGAGRKCFLIGLIVFFLSGISLTAQHRDWVDAALQPQVQTYGIDSLEFPIGAYQYYYAQDRPVEELWPYYRDIGIDIVVFSAAPYNIERFNMLVDSPLRPDDGRVIPIWAPMTEEAGRAVEIIFYPFDSSQTRRWGYHENIFTTVLDDSTRFNPAYEDAPRESVYTPKDSGKIIASGIIYDYKPGETANTSSFTAHRYDPARRTKYIVLQGHLFADRPELSSHPLLAIDLWYQVRSGEKYVDSSGILRTATDDRRFLYKTLSVTPEDFAQPDSVYDFYRTVSLPVDLVRCDSCMGGPLHPEANSRRFDMSVRYLGNEPFALRSVALRDSIAEMLMGDRPEAKEYRDSLRAEIGRLMTNDNGIVREQIIAVYGQDEPDFMEFAGYRELNRFLKENFRMPNGKELPTFTAWGTPFVQHLGVADLVVPEAYMNEPFDLKKGDWSGENNPRFRFQIPYHQPPSIAQHNGGRFGIPLLFDLDSIGPASYNGQLQQRIEAATETFQHTILGRYTPWEPNWPFNNRRTYELGRSARLARRMARRMVTIVGAHRHFELRPNGNGGIDTVSSHPPEPSELRALVNLALAYGSQGIFYFVNNTSYNMLEPKQSYGHDCCQGFAGRTTADTAVDRIDLPLTDHADWNVGYAGGVVHDTIPDLYVGWKSKREELRAINTEWLAGIGPVLAGLRWRDAYSVHFSMRRPGKDAGYQARPLPEEEIVTQVTTRAPTGEPDPPYATYVELGLFDTKIGFGEDGRRDFTLDTNYIFVMNRRTFERPADTMSTQAATVLDSLTETRLVNLQFNMAQPNSTESAYERIRVREVAPDRTALPLIGERQPLDTVLPANERADLTLGPGRAALLEVTYVHENGSSPDQ